MQYPKQNPLETQSIGRLVARFALPGVVSMLVNSLYNIVDQIFIGQGVGYLGNGATNVVFPFTMFALALALLVGNGAATYLSLRMGERMTAEAKQGVGNAVTVLGILGILFLILGGLFLKPLLTLFGATELLMPYALAYGRIIIIGLPFSIIGTGINSIIRADGAPRFAMTSMVLGAVINTILDPLFIFVFHMGMEGAAIATVISQVASFVVSVAYLRHMKSFHFEKRDFIPHRQTVFDVSKLGISNFITQFSTVLVIMVVNNLFVLYGTASSYGAEIPLTAHGIVMKVYSIFSGVLVGLGTGAQPILGYNYGAGNMARVKKTFGVTVMIATCIGLVATVAFQVFPHAIVNLFGSGGDLYNDFAVKDFRIFLMLCILSGFQIVSSIFLQSLGQVAMAAVTSLSRQIIIFIPTSILLCRMIGVEGVMWAGPISDGLAFILSLILVIFVLRKLGKVQHVQCLSVAPVADIGE